MKKRKSKKSNAALEAPAMDKRWQAEDDLRTIERAHEIVGDSTRLSAAKAHAAKQRASLDRIARLDGKKL